MKIAVNTRFLLKNQLEGIGRYSFEILRRMVAQHPEDEFIFLFDRAYDEKYIFGDNVTPVVVSPPSRHPILWYIWFEWAIPRVLKKYQADVFLSLDGYCSLSTDIPTVMVIHDLAFEHLHQYIPKAAKYFYQKYSPLYAEKAKSIIAVSEYTKQDIINQYNISPSKIQVAYNQCGDYFKPISDVEKEAIRKQWSQSKEYFFYAGAVHQRKNVHRLIEAFDTFKEKTKSDFLLIIGGRFAWQTGVVKDAYENAKHRNDIIITGYLSNEDLANLMVAAYALTYVSEFEGFGIPILEAMKSHTPVITSNCTSMPEVAGDAAILVEPTSVESISDAMINLFENKEKRNELIEAGKIQITKFDWQQSMEIIYKSLERIRKKN